MAIGPLPCAPLSEYWLRVVASWDRHFYLTDDVEDMNALVDVIHRAVCECGDGVVNPPIELCDDGNDIAGDGCTHCLRDPICGDGIVEGWESCDDGQMCEDSTPRATETFGGGIGPRSCGGGPTRHRCGHLLSEDPDTQDRRLRSVAS